MVRVRIAQPSFRAMIAGIACLKNIQTWPPFPERERSKNRWRVHLAPSREERGGILLPGLLSKSTAKEPAGVVLQKRVDSDCMIPDKMTTHNLLGQWPELSSLAITFLTILVFGR
jgi:hypothetical protein